VASGFSLVQEITVREHAVFGTMVDDIKSLFRDVRSIGPACFIVMGTGRKTPFLLTLSVPDSRGIDSGPFNDLRLEAVLSEVLREQRRTNRER
jgi:hypothetical protein